MNETITSNTIEFGNAQCYTVEFGKAQSVMNPATQATPVCIPTLFVVPPEVGESWYVKLPGSARIQHVRILEVTEKTMNLMDLESEVTALGRYKKTDIEFVEKA